MELKFKESRRVKVVESGRIWPEEEVFKEKRKGDIAGHTNQENKHEELKQQHTHTLSRKKEFGDSPSNSRIKQGSRVIRS